MSVETEIADLNQRILQAEEAGVKADLATLLHEDFTIIRASGVCQNREEYLDAVPSNARRGRVADRVQVHLYGACAVYRCRVTTSCDKDRNPSLGRYWNTRVFIYENEDWRCVAWQVTEIRKP